MRETIVTTAQSLILGIYVADVLSLESKASATNMSKEEYAHHIEIAERRCIKGIASTLEHTNKHQSIKKVYLVEVCDELLSSWYPISVFLRKKAAEVYAETYRQQNDDIKYFARVTELKVVDA